MPLVSISQSQPMSLHGLSSFFNSLPSLLSSNFFGFPYSVFQEKYHTELVPTAFAPLVQNSTLGPHWPAISMVLGQLGSCYILAMLNSIISFRMINKYVKDNKTRETLVKHGE